MKFREFYNKVTMKFLNIIWLNFSYLLKLFGKENNVTNKPMRTGTAVHVCSIEKDLREKFRKTHRKTLVPASLFQGQELY